MAGPGASILLPTTAIAQDITRFIEDTFQTMDSTNPFPEKESKLAFNGWIEKRPFKISRGFDYEEQLEDMDLERFSHFFAWRPADIINISAMAHQPEDHRVLARLALLLAEKFQGIIDFGGIPWTFSNDLLAKFPGRYLALRAFDAGDPISEDPADYVCDGAFLRHWMEHPDFKMAK